MDLLVPNLEPSGPTGAGGPRGCKSGLPSGIGNDSEPEAMLMARMLARLDGECAQRAVYQMRAREASLKRRL